MPKATQPKPPSPWNWRAAIPWAGLALMTLAAYAPALRCGFVWDDQAVTENPFLHSAAGLWTIWAHPGALPRETHYWPLVYSVFWVQVQLWGLNAAGFHLVNVLLHAANSLLLWRVLRRLGAPGAWLAAALFALHPLHVESVAWVIELKDVLSAFFYLLAFGAWLRFERERGAWTYALAAALFVAGMLCKSIVVTLPVALALTMWWRRGALGRREWLPLLPLLGLAAALAGFDVLIQPAGHGMASLPPLARVARAAHACWFYLAKLCWPAPLMTFYPAWPAPAQGWGVWLYPLSGALALAGLWWGRRRIGRGPLVAVLFFVVTLGPILGLVEFDFLRLAAVADRFAYLASIGPLALVAAIVTLGSRRLAIDLKAKSSKLKAKSVMGTVLAVVLLGVLGGLTWRQAALYQNNETLFEYNLRYNDRAWAAHSNVGYYQVHHGKAAEARGHFEAAIRINPECEMALGNLGVLLAQEGKLDAAAACLERALAASPRYTEALVMLGNVYQAQHRLDPAIELYRRALDLNQANPLAHYNLSLALAARGFKEEAARERREALRLNPALARP